MEIYIKNKEGLLEETTLRKVLIEQLEYKFELDIGSFNGENYNWIGIEQESKAPSKVSVNIIFEDDGNTIQEIKVYEVPLVTIEDNDNSKQII